MSLMRINHVKNETKKLKEVIITLIKNYEKDFKDYDSRLRDAEGGLSERERNAHEAQDYDVLSEVIEEKMTYVMPLENLRSLGQFQNELMLVKHVALIESMIVQLFNCLTCLLQHEEYRDKYFYVTDNFSDSFEAAGKISELTGGSIKLKKMHFWYFYETLKIIRNTVAHGDPLFVLSYRRAKKFNEKINIIHLYGEKNECASTKGFYPSLLSPTYEDKSNWFCCLKNDLRSLTELNSQCSLFIEEVRKAFLKYGKDNSFSEHELYGCQPFSGRC